MWNKKTSNKLKKRKANCSPYKRNPQDHFIIGTKWIFKNKLDGHGYFIKNKTRPVAQRHSQEEGIEHEETFVHVAWQIYPDTSCLCLLSQLHTISNECEKHFPKWIHQGGSLCEATSGLWRPKWAQPCAPNSTNACMVLSKHLGLGMRDLLSFL